MTAFAVLATATGAADQAAVSDLSRLLVWVAIPAAILGAVVAGVIKRAVLARPRYSDHRPPPRTYVWVAIADLVAWAVLWPALLAVRIQGLGSGRALWTAALLLVVALGYLANRYGFARALHPETAGSVRGTLIAELFTILMPLLSVLFGVIIYYAVRLLAG
jgi:hypothetical protein